MDVEYIRSELVNCENTKEYRCEFKYESHLINFIKIMFSITLCFIYIGFGNL